MQSINLVGFEAFCRDQRGLSEHSLRAYRQDLKSFNNFLADNDQPLIGQDTVLAYQRDLREERSASPATTRRRMVTLRAYFAWREEQDPAFVSPFKGLRLDLRIPQRLPRPVDRPVLSAVLRNTEHIATVNLDRSKTACTDGAPSKDQVTGLMVRLLVVTGLRIGELTNIRLRDVMGAGAQIRVMGKGSRERTVYVTNDMLLADFGTYLGIRRRQSDVDSHVFLNSRDCRLTEAAFGKRLRSLSQALQIEPHITPHRFRHSAATLLIEEGVDIRLVQRLLGHASISTTEIYTKVSDNSLFQAIEHADTLAKVDS